MKKLRYWAPGSVKGVPEHQDGQKVPKHVTEFAYPSTVFVEEVYQLGFRLKDGVISLPDTGKSGVSLEMDMAIVPIAEYREEYSVHPDCKPRLDAMRDAFPEYVQLLRPSTAETLQWLIRKAEES